MVSKPRNPTFKKDVPHKLTLGELLKPAQFLQQCPSLCLPDLWLLQFSFSLLIDIKWESRVLCICHTRLTFPEHFCPLIHTLCETAASSNWAHKLQWPSAPSATCAYTAVPQISLPSWLNLKLAQPSSQLRQWQQGQDKWHSATSHNILQCCKLSPHYVTPVNSIKQSDKTLRSFIYTIHTGIFLQGTVNTSCSARAMS